MTKRNCINLKERFGDRYKIAYDDAAAFDARSPWLQIIPCRAGEIGPYDERHLLVSTKTPGSIAERLKKLPGARVWQDGSDGASVVVPVESFEEVAKLMGARRRRRLSSEAQAAQAERLAKHRFRPAVEISPKAQDCEVEGLLGELDLAALAASVAAARLHRTAAEENLRH